MSSQGIDAPTTNVAPAAPSRWRRARRLVGRLATIYVGVCLVMMACETRLVYAPPPLVPELETRVVDAEDAMFTSADGTKLHGLLFRAAGSAEAVLYCHGNGEDVARDVELARRYRDLLGANVLVFDYRGYGQSEGSPYEDGVIADGSAAQEWLAEQCGCGVADVVLIGRSLGGGVATALAHRHGARGLVLQNTFASLHETAAGRYPWLPVEWLIRNRYPSIEWIAGYRGPLLQSHGTSDQLIPFSEGRRLFAACPSDRKEFFAIKGGDHNDREPSEYDAALERWYEALPIADGK